MPKSPRPFKVADRIQVELSEIIARRLKDPRRGFLTVTGVDMTPDLRNARVYVSTLDETSLAEAIGLLDHAKGFLRSELGKRLHLRHTPDLEFCRDRSVVAGRRIEDILTRIHEEDAERPRPEPPEETETEADEDDPA